MVLPENQSNSGEDHSLFPVTEPAQTETAQVEATQVEATQVENTQIKNTQTENIPVATTQVENTQTENIQAQTAQIGNPPTGLAEPLPETLMTIEDVQRVLGRSRATVYRYTNTDPKGKRLNLPYNPRFLNPEHRVSFRDPLQFHPTEVARYAQDILQIRNVNIEVVQHQSETDDVLKAILEELRDIRQLLEKWTEREN